MDNRGQWLRAHRRQYRYSGRGAPGASGPVFILLPIAIIAHLVGLITFVIPGVPPSVGLALVSLSFVLAAGGGFLELIAAPFIFMSLETKPSVLTTIISGPIVYALLALIAWMFTLWVDIWLGWFLDVNTFNATGFYYSLEGFLVVSVVLSAIYRALPAIQQHFGNRA